VAVAEHQLAVARAGVRDGHRQVVRRAGDPLQHDALAGELVDAVGLRHAAGHVDDLVHDPPRRGGGVDGEVAAQVRRGDPGGGEQQRRVERAGGGDGRGGLDDHASPTPRRRHDPGRAPARVDPDPTRARARVGRGAGGVRAVHVGLAGVLLGAGRAAERADAGALAATDVTVQEMTGPAEPLGAPLGDQGVGAGEVLGDALHADRLLDAGVGVVERAGPEVVQAELVGPLLLDGGRDAEAGA
jgi:hypothetical protein